MIITLKDANFSENKVGTLDTWGITKILRGVSTADITTRINKNGRYEASFTVDSGYIYSSASVTMGGVDVTNSVLSWNSNYSKVDLVIPEVTGNVYINITALSETTVATMPIPVTPHFYRYQDGDTLKIEVTNKNSFAVQYEQLPDSVLPGKLSGTLQPGEKVTFDDEIGHETYRLSVKFSANGYLPISETYTADLFDQDEIYGGEEFVGTYFFSLGDALEGTTESDSSEEPHIALYKKSVYLDETGDYHIKTAIDGVTYYVSLWSDFANGEYVKEELISEFKGKFLRTATLDSNVQSSTTALQVTLGQKLRCEAHGYLYSNKDTSKVLK